MKPEIDTTMRGMLKPGLRGAYLTAGNATITIRSAKSGQRFTYRIRSNEPENGKAPLFFVKVLNGPDNVSAYTYLGTIFPNGFRATKASYIAEDAPSFVAFKWFSDHRESELVEVWHEGSCGKCGRKLTVPESIESGIGPTCAGKSGIELPPPPKVVATAKASSSSLTALVAALEQRGLVTSNV